MKRAFFIFFALCAILSSCTDKPLLSEFSETDVVRMEIDGRTILVYNPLTCQLSFNRDKCEFGVHTDTMADYFMVTLSEIPSELGQEVSADITWTTDTDVKTKQNVTLMLVNSQGDRLWLWDATGKTGLEVRVLE